MTGGTAAGSTPLQVQGIEGRKRMKFSQHLGKKKMPPAKAAPQMGMEPAGTPQGVEEKLGAKMAAGMPKRKTFGQRIAQREK
jgi:hypothetical protein